MTNGTAPVKYIVGILTAHDDLMEQALHYLREYFGPTDYQSQWYPFDHTNFYGSEMGHPLKRAFVSFENLQPPELIYKAKIWCAKVEDRFRENEGRQVNLDPGYVDYFKLVLASGKFGGHKVAITKGCWVDFISMYSKGVWQPMPWCFPDFESGIYDKDMTEIRRLFKIARQRLGK